MPAEVLHAAGVELGRNYPERLVSHVIAREVAWEAYGQIKSAGQCHRQYMPRRTKESETFGGTRDEVWIWTVKAKLFVPAILDAPRAIGEGELVGDTILFRPFTCQ